MSGALTKTTPHFSASSSPSSSPLVADLLQSLPSSTINHHHIIGAEGNQQQQQQQITDPWKKFSDSQNNTTILQVMGTSSWPSLPLSRIRAAIIKGQIPEPDVPFDTQDFIKHLQIDETISNKEVSFPKIRNSSTQEPAAMVQNVTGETSCNKRSENKDSYHDETSKLTLISSISVDNDNRSEIERRDSSDFATHGSQRSFNNRSKQKSRPTNNSNFSGYQNQKNHNSRNHHPRYLNSKNPNWSFNHGAPVNRQSHVGIPGFHGPPHPPPQPFTYSHFGSINNPPHANMPFFPIPLPLPQPVQYTSYVMPVNYCDTPYFPGGTSFSPQASQPDNFQDPDAGICNAVRRQIEYYFSDDNLVTDHYLRNHMDAHGWVSANLIANFNKVRRMTRDVDLILRALRFSQHVEVQGNKIRKRGSWWSWILPKSTQLHSEDYLVHKVGSIDLNPKYERGRKPTESALSSASS